jgi:hypothetical protein
LFSAAGGLTGGLLTLLSLTTTCSVGCGIFFSTGLASAAAFFAAFSASNFVRLLFFSAIQESG